MVNSRVDASGVGYDGHGHWRLDGRGLASSSEQPQQPRKEHPQVLQEVAQRAQRLADLLLVGVFAVAAEAAQRFRQYQDDDQRNKDARAPLQHKERGVGKQHRLALLNQQGFVRKLRTLAGLLLLHNVASQLLQQPR